MKILMINKFLFPNGGSETYIFKLGEELIRQGNEVQYFGMEHEGRCVGNRVNAYTKDMDFHGGSKLSKLIYPFKIIYSKEAYKKLMMVLNDFEPDAVHINNFNYQLTPSILYATRRWAKKNNKKVKIVYTAHDGQLVCPNHLMQQFYSNERCEQCLTGGPWRCASNKCIHGSGAKSILGSIEASIYRKLKTYRLFDTVICPSRFMKDKLDTLPELAKSTVVLQNFNYQPVSEQEKEGSYILYFGRYSHEKGVDTLLKVCEKFPDEQFVFAGNGPLESRVNEYKNIRNMGFLNGADLTELISGAYVTIFPSECNENCPFSVMESISNGVPVIGSRVGGVPELISEGINGYTFEPGNDKELSSIISRLLKDKAELNKLAKGARNTTFLTIGEYANQITQYYI